MPHSAAALVIASLVTETIATAIVKAKAPLNVIRYANEHGVSYDGCRTMQDVKDRVDMMRHIATGWRTRTIK